LNQLPFCRESDHSDEGFFFGYYAPTENQYDLLWKEAIIVLDANVLLDLYRLPPTAREEMLAVLTELKERLWIPYQVALEFQRQRLNVISTERRATEDALEAAKSLVDALKRKVDALQIDKYGLGLDSVPLIADLEQANRKLIDAITTVHSSQLDIAASDPIRDRLDNILSDKIGPGPATQAELDALTVDGDQRYADKIPPGYADADKDKNPSQAAFFHNQIKYQRKFGDLILWRRLLSHVAKANVTSVLFVTADQKEDWWWREQGKTIGVHPELVLEIRKLSTINIFWMYSSVQFLSRAKTYVTTKVSDQSVAELQEVSANPRRFSVPILGVLRTPRLIVGDKNAQEGDLRLPGQAEYGLIEGAVYDWLSEAHGEVIVNKEFPDFIVLKEDDVHGYEVKILRSFERMLFTPQIVNSMLRGYLQVNEGKLSTFTMIVIIKVEEFDNIKNTDRLIELRSRIVNLLRKYPISGLVVGTVVEGGQFEPLTYVGFDEIESA
jgi:predicted nucleic acid-binding protein